ncbi:MAG: fibronectin type III domain-containing protein, partial [Ruminococcus sp.]|nr:fibronectin type III domain-containing protein [Ruminococcus sp.]
TGTTILTAPAGLYVTGSSSGVKLTWSAANGAAYYRVYRKTGSSFTRIADKVTALTYTDKTAPAVRTVYTVKAVYSIDGKLKISSGAKNSAVNAVPTQTSAYAITSRTSRIRIGWNAVSNCTGYKVYMYNSATKKYAAVKTVSSKNTTSCVVSGLKSGTKYKFKVRPYKKGVNGICWGKYSKAIGIWTK